MNENCGYCGLPPPYPDRCVIEGNCAKDQARIRAAYLRGLEDAVKVVAREMAVDGAWADEVAAAIRALAKEGGE